MLSLQQDIPELFTGAQDRPSRAEQDYPVVVPTLFQQSCGTTAGAGQRLSLIYLQEEIGKRCQPITLPRQSEQDSNMNLPFSCTQRSLFGVSRPALTQALGQAPLLTT